MRISDWSSDVCSSDLRSDALAPAPPPAQVRPALPVRGNELFLHRLRQQVRRQQALVEQEVVEPQSAEPVAQRQLGVHAQLQDAAVAVEVAAGLAGRSEEHTSELQSLMRISYAVFCLKKKKNNKKP